MTTIFIYLLKLLFAAILFTACLVALVVTLPVQAIAWFFGLKDQR